MRKQDRVAAQHKQEPREQTQDTRQPERPRGEDMKGSASTNEEASHPPRQGNRMPIPD